MARELTSVMSRPRFSVVAAAYNVGRYLPEFIGSLEQQSFDLRRVQVIVVDDGSTDDTGQQLADWQARRPELVTVLSQTNGGQASARNLGLTVASGEWVTFIDSDDFVDGNYFKRVDHFLAHHPETEMVATLRLLYWDDRGETVPHALWRLFADGDRVVNLDDNPQYFHVSAPAAFFKLRRIQGQSLTFDPRVGPHFEDGHFCVQYLLHCSQPEVAFVQSAKYTYRRRADSTSTTQTNMTLPARFINVPEYGYLDVLRNAQARLGYVPSWLQHQIVYELRWYLKAASEPGESAMASRGATAERFLILLAEVLTFIDPAVISSFDAQPLTSEWRDILLHSFRDSPWHGAYAVITDVDESQNLARVEYRFVGSPPSETFLFDDTPVQPAYAKYRSVQMFDHTIIHERIVWVPKGGSLRLRLDGEPIPVLPEWPTAPAALPRRTQPQVMAWKLASHGSGSWLIPLMTSSTGWARSLRRGLYQRVAGSAFAKSRYADAWVLDDGPRGVMRSSEDLFEYLREQRNDINCWFVTERNSSAWSRLNAERRESHVVARGSKQWQMLMLNCAVLVSSDPDPLAHRPLEIAKFQDPQWKSVFLPATVIQEDLSRSLNPKQADLIMTTTPDEYDSIVRDGTGYRYTAKEVSLTGLPRFDRLRKCGKRISLDQRDLVLVSPYLPAGLLESSVARSRSSSVSADSWLAEYRAEWLTFLRSPDLQRCVQDRELTLILLQGLDPRPFDTDGVPEHVHQIQLSEYDPAALLARAAVFVTDYSPLAFDAAYLDRPVVYAQMAGRWPEPTAARKHTYYDVDQQGWGPVTRDPDEAVAAVESALVSADPADLYANRIAQAFPYRGESTSERVTCAIEKMTGTQRR